MWKVIPLGFALLFIGFQLIAQPPAGNQQPNPDKKNQPPQPGQLLPPFLQDQLNLTDAQKKQLSELQKKVDSKVATILKESQKQQLKEMRENGPGGFGPKGKGGPGGNGGFGKKFSPIHDIMVKLGRGPESLEDMIGDELETNSPPWDKLRAQTKEFKGLVAALAKEQPAKGSKESWAKLTGQFVDSAVALDQSVQKKDKDEALKVHKVIADSCMAWHRQHKGGPGGGFAGGPGGPGGFPDGGPGGPGGGKGKGPGGFGPGGFGGGKGKGPGGFGGPPQPGQILPSFLQERLNLTGVQKKKVNDLQSQVDTKLGKILTDAQRQQLKEMGNRGPGGFGPGGGFGPSPGGGFGPPPGGPGGTGGQGPPQGKKD